MNQSLRVSCRGLTASRFLDVVPLCGFVIEGLADSRSPQGIDLDDAQVLGVGKREAALPDYRDEA
jgi:hypothetical protein